MWPCLSQEISSGYDVSCGLQIQRELATSKYILLNEFYFGLLVPLKQIFQCILWSTRLTIMWQKFWNAKPVVLLLLQDFAESNTTLSQPPCAILHSSILSVSDIASISSNPSIDSSTCLLNSPFQCNIAFTAILLSMTEKTISTYTILVVLIFGLLVRPDHAASLLLSIKLQVPPTFLAPEGDFLHRLDNSHPHSASPSRKKYASLRFSPNMSSPKTLVDSSHSMGLCSTVSPSAASSISQYLSSYNSTCSSPQTPSTDTTTSTYLLNDQLPSEHLPYLSRTSSPSTLSHASPSVVTQPESSSNMMSTVPSQGPKFSSSCSPSLLPSASPSVSPSETPPSTTFATFLQWPSLSQSLSSFIKSLAKLTSPVIQASLAMVSSTLSPHTAFTKPMVSPDDMNPTEHQCLLLQNENQPWIHLLLSPTRQYSPPLPFHTYPKPKPPSTLHQVADHMLPVTKQSYCSHLSATIFSPRASSNVKPCHSFPA